MQPSSPGVLVAQWLEYCTDVMEVMGSIPTWDSENPFSSSFTYCQATIAYIINILVLSMAFYLSDC